MLKMLWWWRLAWLHIACIHDMSIDEISQNFLRHTQHRRNSLLCLVIIALFIAFCYLYIYGWVDKACLFLSGDFWPLGLFCCVSDKDSGYTISLVQVVSGSCISDIVVGVMDFGTGRNPTRLWMNDSCFDQPLKYRLFWHNQANKLNNTPTYLFLYFQFWFGLAQPQYLEMAPSKKGVSMNVIIGVYSSSDLKLLVLYYFWVVKHLAITYLLANFLIFMVENSHCGYCCYIKLLSIVLMIPKHR